MNAAIDGPQRWRVLLVVLAVLGGAVPQTLAEDELVPPPRVAPDPARTAEAEVALRREVDSFLRQRDELVERLVAVARDETDARHVVAIRGLAEIGADAGLRCLARRVSFWTIRGPTELPRGPPGKRMSGFAVSVQEGLFSELISLPIIGSPRQPARESR